MIQENARAQDQVHAAWSFLNGRMPVAGRGRYRSPRTGGTQTRRAPRRSASVWATALLIAASGCTPEATAPPNPTTGPPSLPAPPPVASPAPGIAGRDAVAAYRGMWQAYQAAMAIPDPKFPDLKRYADGEALDVLMKGVQETKDDGLKGTGAVVLSPEVTSAAPMEAPTEVEITDCLDSSGSQIVRASPGPPYSDAPGGKRRTTATVRWQTTGWKVINFGVLDVGTC